MPLPLHPVLGRRLVGPRAHTAPGTTTHPSTGRQTAGGSSQTWIHTDRALLALEQVEPLIHGRLASIKSALVAVDPDGSGTVSREELRRVLERPLSVSQNQLDALLSEVCERSGDTVDCTQFLRRFRRAPAARGAGSNARRGPQNTSMSLPEIQKHLKEKIGGNLRTMMRVFRLFDYNREGHIQQHEFRRILDSYCIPLTDKEFQRLWNHYSPNNTSTISYQLFLHKLGFAESHNFNIAPVCTKLEVSSRGTTPPEKVKQRKHRPESVSSSCDAPSVLPHRKLQTLFYNKMCANYTPVWQALQAFDTTHSDLVKQDVLRAVLSSFIFPMNPRTFKKLTSCYGVSATGPVRWKHFLSHFMSSVVEEGDTSLDTDSACKQPTWDEDSLDLQDIYPGVKKIFHKLDTKEAGWITRADLRHSLERPGGTQPRLQPLQITALLNALDPEHSGVVQLASLEKLKPSVASAPTGDTAPPHSPDNTAELQDVPEETEDTAKAKKTPDEKQTTQCADKVSVASRRTVENLLLDKLCEQLGSVLAALKQCDPQHTGYITREDLKEVLSCYAMPMPTDTHFNRLCEASSSRPGSPSNLVHYTGFLRNLGVPLSEDTDSSSSHRESFHTKRPCSSPQSILQSVEGQRAPSGLWVSPDTCSIVDNVLQRMRSGLEQRNSSLADRVQAITHRSDGTLSETDVRKILEDSSVILDDKDFHRFTELLGFRDGRIEGSVFLAKYEEATARDGQQGSEDHGSKAPVLPLPQTAEQCLAAMKSRIKVTHGDNLTAFRLMDRTRKGVVSCHDFKKLYSSLGFNCREGEYQRLLDLIGLHPGGNLNYTEFLDVVENGRRKQGAQTASVQEQLHDLLAREARYKWADMSKVLCQFDTDDQGWIHKKSLRGFLFTFALPMRSDEFDELWLRYDPESQGCVAVPDFLAKLGFYQEGELRPPSPKLNQTAAQQDPDRPSSCEAASLERTEQTFEENCERLSDSLTHLETGRGGAVTAEELQARLHTYSCSDQREQLLDHLHRLKVSMDDNCKKLACMDFLSTSDHKADKKHERPPVSPDVTCQIQSLDSLSPDVALARMRELVTASAPHLRKAFLAFDRSGTGMVKALEFRQVLENFCARLSDKQYRYMLTKLELDCENCTVNWKHFLNKFQSQSPLMSADGCLGRTCETGTKTRSPVQTRSSEITEHQQRIQEVVSGHLHEITKDLMDLDPCNGTTVSKEQFRQLCDHHCLRLTNDQFECVWSQMPVNGQRRLQSREFLRRFASLGRTPHTDAGGPTNNIPSPSLEPSKALSARKSHCPGTAGASLQRTKSAPQCTSRRPASMGRPLTGSPLGGIERRLRGAVQRCWKEIQRNCAERDPQQEGHISTTSFLEILQSLGISVTQEQFEHLAAKFDIMNNGCVSYHNFLRHFVLNLKPAEAKRAFERRKLPPPVMPTHQGVLSKGCVEVMLRIHDAVRSYWTSIRRCFLTSDRSRAGTVSVQDFRKVLRLFSVHLSEEEFFHLTSYFDANTTGKICYNNFLWPFLH